MERRCLTTAENLASEFRHYTPPFSLGPLLKHFEIARVTERPLDRDACLKRGSEGLYIEVNSLYPMAIRRMAIGHEIGHLIVSQSSTGGHSHWGHYDKRIEDLCDRLAVVLLAPSWAVSRFLEHKHVTHLDGFGKSILKEAALFFGMPTEMISPRLAQVNTTRSVLTN